MEIEEQPQLASKPFQRQRRGAVSAAPITEDEATSYVKKVNFFESILDGDTNL